VPGRLDDLVGRDFVRPAVGTVTGEVAFSFKHLLVREAAYRATTKRLRAALHERFADWLERLAGDRIAEYQEILGYHLEQAYRYRRETGALDSELAPLGERAATHLERAGARAEALSDHHAAANLLQRALAVGLADPHRRVRAQAELGSALGQTRQVGEADRVLTEAIETANRLGERGIAAQALIRRGWNRTGDPAGFGDDRIAECRVAIETFTELGDQRGLADAHRLLALPLANHGRWDEARRELELALVAADASGDAERRRSVVNTLTNIAYIGGPTPVSEGIALCERLADSASSDRVVDATLNRSLGVLYAMAGRRDDARESLARAAVVLDDVRIRSIEVHRHRAAYGRKLCGDRDGAERELRMMWDFFRDVSRFDSRAWIAAVTIASLYCDEGRFDEARDLLAYGRGRYEDTRRWVAVEASLAAGEGRLDDAAALAARLVARVEPADSPNDAIEFLAGAAKVQLAAGLTAEAGETTRRALALCDKKENVAAAELLRAVMAPQ
jgi:tetratricopeptide (TPR) repeat protein